MVNCPYIESYPSASLDKPQQKQLRALDGGLRMLILLAVSVMATCSALVNASSATSDTTFGALGQLAVGRFWRA